eukprot:gene9962-6955_t
MSSCSAAKEEERKKQLYSRQEYVVGAEAQRKYGATEVLVVGATGPAAEIIKNLALTGVKAVYVLDSDRITHEDLGSNFFFRESDVGQVRSQTLAAAAAELNRFVQVTSVSGDIAALIPRVHVVVFVNHLSCTLHEWNQLARRHSVKFVACESRGVTGSIFVDGGDSFEVLDRDGEELLSCIVTSITPDGIVSLHEDKKHECEVGSEVYFTGVASPARINSTIPSPAAAAGMTRAEQEAATRMVLYEVAETLTPYVLRLRGLTQAIGSQSIDIGTTAYLHTTKKKQTMSFLPLQESLQHPTFSVIYDKDEKADAAEHLHALYRAVSDAGRIPSSDAEVQAAVAAAKQYCATLDAAVATALLTVFRGDLNPMACFIGGIAAQEALKLCSGKFTPIHQWMYYDARELLQLRGGDPSSWWPSEAAASSRHAGQMAVLGEAFQDYIGRQRAFIVGAGALGCELIKNAALVGLGGVSITDMDTVEMSNLSRQFLFRDHHIGKPKATVAAQSAQAIQPQLQISSYELKVGPETEGTFSETFWNRHAVVLNALDNVSSRQYVDERCLFYKRPLFESGTLGTKCNVQCVIPYVTESYSQSFDPPEKSIPLCTLKNFPNAIEHTIQWARDQFHLLFHNTPDDVNQYLLNFQGFAASMLRDPAAASMVLCQVDKALRSWPKDEKDCIIRARLLFHEYFNENFRQLLHNIPLTKRNEDGCLFWSGAKKPPTPLDFNKDRPDDVDFVYHTACLLAKVYNIGPIKAGRESVAATAAAVPVPPFVPRVAVFATSEKDQGQQQQGSGSGGEIDVKDLPPVMHFSGRRMAPETFEKDDITNHHMQFITSCSNLRALAYGIPVADLTATKRIAGSIIPAMVTTTSLVTGLVCMEMLKYLLLQFQSYQKGHLVPPPPTPQEVTAQLSVYRNGFVNIAIPLIAFSDPVMAQGRTYQLPSGAAIRWSAWDRIDIDEGRDISVKELVKLLEERYEMDVSMLSLTSGKMIFMQFGGKAKDKEQPVSGIAQQRGEVLKPGCDYLDLIATGSIGEEDVDVPIIRYKFRNFLGDHLKISPLFIFGSLPADVVASRVSNQRACEKNNKQPENHLYIKMIIVRNRSPSPMARKREGSVLHCRFLLTPTLSPRVLIALTLHASHTVIFPLVSPSLDLHALVGVYTYICLLAHPPNPDTIEYVDQEKYADYQTVVYIRAVQLNRLPEVVQFCEGIAVTITAGGSSYTLPAMPPTDEMAGEERSPRNNGCQTFTMVWDDVSLMFPGSLYRGDGPTFLPFPFEFVDGVHIAVHSADGTRDFGTALVKGSEEHTMLSYPRGDVQVLFKVYHCCDGEVVYTRSCQRRKRTPAPTPPAEAVEEEEEEEEQKAQPAAEEAPVVAEAEAEAPPMAAAEDLDEALQQIEVCELEAQEAERLAAEAEARAAEAQEAAARLEAQKAGAEHRCNGHRAAAAAEREAATAEKRAAHAEGNLAQAYSRAIELGATQEDFPEREAAAKERQEAALARMQAALERAEASDAKAQAAEKELADLLAAAAQAEQDAAAQQKKATELADAVGDADTRSNAADAFTNAANLNRYAAAADRAAAAHQVDGTANNKAAEEADARAAECDARAAGLREAPAEAPAKEEPAAPKEEPTAPKEEPTAPKKGLNEDEEGGGLGTEPARSFAFIPTLGCIQKKVEEGPDRETGPSFIGHLYKDFQREQQQQQQERKEKKRNKITRKFPLDGMQRTGDWRGLQDHTIPFHSTHVHTCFLSQVIDEKKQTCINTCTTSLFTVLIFFGFSNLCIIIHVDTTVLCAAVVLVF